MQTRVVLLGTLLLFGIAISSAAVINSASSCTADCTWTSANSWANGVPPGANDDANITGTIAITAAELVTVKQLTVAKDATLILNAGATVTNLILSGTLNLTGGDLSITGTATAIKINSGSVINWSGGNIANPTTKIEFAPGSTLNVIAGSPKILNRDASVNGTLNIASTLAIGTGRSLYASGALNLQTGSSIVPDAGATGVQLFAYGTNSISSESGSQVTLSVKSSFTGAVSVSGGELILTNGVEFVFSSPVTVATAGTLTVDSMTQFAGVLKTDGKFQWTNGNITSSSSVSFNGETYFSNPNSAGFRISSGITNNGNFHIHEGCPTTIQGVFTNVKDMEIEAPLTVLGLAINGGSVGGGSEIFTSTQFFNWTAGIIQSPITAKGPAVISGSGYKELYRTTLTFNAPNAASEIQLSGTITMRDGAKIANEAGSVINSGSDGIISICDKCDFQDVTLVNAGTIQGTLKLNGVIFVNSGTIGGDYAKYNKPTQIDVAIAFSGGTCTFSENSVIYADVYSEDTRTYVNCACPTTIGGQLYVRLRRGLTANDDTRVTVFSYKDGKQLSGNFAAAPSFTNIDGWDNLLNCDAWVVDQNTGTNGWVVSFDGCEIPSPPPKSKTKSKTGIVLIVIVVVVAVVFAVGLTAWCKKKYRKKPWDRLKTSRL